MREILFRGKRIDNGEWVEGDLLRAAYFLNGKERHYIFTDCEEYPGNEFIGYKEVNPETVGQFTGLTDKNGKQIFEGDIVNGLFLFGMEIKAVVAFQDGAFGLQWNRGNVTEFSAFTSICNVTYEVVGNIHDNPELLGGAEDE